MTWQLLRRDCEWRMAVVIAAVMVVLTAAASTLLPLPDKLPSREAFRAELGILPVSLMVFMIFLVFNVQARRDRYEAALPIRGRDAWLSRVLSLLTLNWVPMLLGIACGFPAKPLLEAGAVYTVMVLGIKSFRIGQVGVSQRFLNVGFQIASLSIVIVPFLAMRARSASWFVMPPASAILGVCGLASLILFRLGWTTVPASFQMAGSESGMARRESGPMLLRDVSGSSSTWAPVLRSIYGRNMILLVIFLAGNIFFSLWAASLVVGTVQVQLRAQCRWLLALPVSQRRLFAWIAAPQTAAIIVDCVAAAFFDTRHPLTVRGRLVQAAAEIAVVYAMIFLSELSAWSRLSRLRAVRFGVWILWIPFAIGCLAPVFVLPDTEAFQRLAGSLPGSWWQLAGVLAMPVAGAYWLAEKAFREREYRQLLVETGAVRMRQQP